MKDVFHLYWYLRYYFVMIFAKWQKSRQKLYVFFYFPGLKPGVIVVELTDKLE